MVYRYLSELKPHPKNEYYFDNTTDGSFEILKDSLRKAEDKKVDNEILITKDNVIICGHQRVRAAKELGWEKINCKVEKDLTDEEVEIKLITDNLTQRGAKGLNELKLGRCLNKLCEFYGLEKGNNQHTTDERIGNYFRSTIGEFSTRRELVEAFGLIERTANNYQSLAKNSGEELEEAVLSGKIKPTNAISISRLPKEQQKEVVAFVEENGKVSGAKIEEKIKTLKEESQSDEKIKGAIESKQFKDTIKQNEEEIQSKEQNEDIVTFDDIEMYFKYGNGSDYEKEKLKMLKEYISDPVGSIDCLDDNRINYMLTDYVTKIKNNILKLSDVEKLKENIKRYINKIKSSLDDFENILEGVNFLESTINQILDYVDEETVTGCDDEGFLYNVAGKKIGQISNYKRNGLIYDYIKEDENDEDVFYAYDKNGKKLGDIVWFLNK